MFLPCSEIHQDSNNSITNIDRKSDFFIDFESKCWISILYKVLNKRHFDNEFSDMTKPRLVRRNIYLSILSIYLTYAYRNVSPVTVHTELAPCKKSAIPSTDNSQLFLQDGTTKQQDSQTSHTTNHQPMRPLHENGNEVIQKFTFNWKGWREERERAELNGRL